MNQYKPMIVKYSIAFLCCFWINMIYAWQPVPYKATYTASVSSMPINGQAQYSLSKLADNSWQLNTSAGLAIVQIKEQTNFTITDKTIRPSYYEHIQSGIKTKKISYRFNWEKSFAQGKVDDEDVFFSLKFKMLDPLSSQIALQQDIAEGKKTMSYPVLNKGKVETYTFKVLGEEIIKTPVGKINTLKIQRVRTDNKRQTLIWFAKDWGYCVVQLYQKEKNGTEYLISLSAGKVNGKSIKGF